MKSSINEFITEAEDIIESAQSLTLELQESIEKERINPDTVNALFRDMHTLKGLSGLFGLKSITELSHRLEFMLDDLRLGKIESTDELTEFLLKNIDILRSFITDAESNRDVDVSDYIRDIDNFKGRSAAKEPSVSLKDVIDDTILNVLSEYEEHRLKANIEEGNGIYSLKANFPLDDFDKMLAALSGRIKKSGELLSTLPTSENVPSGGIGFNLIIGSKKRKDELDADIGQGTEILVPPRVEKKNEDAGSSLKSISSTVRVDIEKLDRILNTIGEINLAKGAVKRIGNELFEELGHQKLVVDTYKVAQSLEKWVSDLQDQVLDIRMVPIGQIFSRLSQVIRRFSRQMKKKINLRMFGEDTNIDKYLAEEAVDPLMHIVRNSIDHGIEGEDERTFLGKPPEGAITLRAFQKGNHVVVEVKDDGRGIDMEKVRAKALDKGLMDKDTDYTEKELLELVFLPGFTTAGEVTEVSGRGVGMDIVKERISSLGGFVLLESEKGGGTTVSVTLPITLAILKALMVKVGTERFAIPLSSISESFMAQADMFQTIEGKMVINLREDLLPLVHLGEIFDIQHAEVDEKFVVVVGYGERRTGLLVDELFGQQEIVIKSLGDYFKGVKGFAGATEIGKHEIVLVIDVEALIEKTLLKHKERSHV